MGEKSGRFPPSAASRDVRRDLRVCAEMALILRSKVLCFRGLVLQGVPEMTPPSDQLVIPPRFSFASRKQPEEIGRFCRHLVSGRWIGALEREITTYLLGPDYLRGPVETCGLPRRRLDQGQQKKAPADGATGATWDELQGHGTLAVAHLGGLDAAARPLGRHQVDGGEMRRARCFLARPQPLTQWRDNPDWQSLLAQPSRRDRLSAGWPRPARPAPPYDPP